MTIAKLRDLTHRLAEAEKHERLAEQRLQTALRASGAGVWAGVREMIRDFGNPQPVFLTVTIELTNGNSAIVHMHWEWGDTDAPTGSFFPGTAFGNITAKNPGGSSITYGTVIGTANPAADIPVRLYTWWDNAGTVAAGSAGAQGLSIYSLRMDLHPANT